MTNLGPCSLDWLEPNKQQERAWKDEWWVEFQNKTGSHQKEDKTRQKDRQTPFSLKLSCCFIVKSSLPFLFSLIMFFSSWCESPASPWLLSAVLPLPQCVQVTQTTFICSWKSLIWMWMNHRCLHLLMRPLWAGGQKGKSRAKSSKKLVGSTMKSNKFACL